MIIYPDNSSKYFGSILKLKKKVQYIIFKNKKKYIIKELYYKDYNKDSDAIDEINTFRKTWSIDNNKVLNVIENIENKYLKVSIGEDNYLLADIQDKEIIEKYNWRIHNGGCYVTRLVPIKDRVSSKREYITFHEDILKNKDSNEKNANYKNVNHKNNNKLDNRRENLGEITIEKLGWKNQHCNKKMRSDNTSGHTGVYRGDYKGYHYWEFKGFDYNGNRIQKKYGVKKWGEDGAKALAHKFRDMLIDKSYKID